MATAILATKLYVPPPRRAVVPRPRLIERLNEGLKRAPNVTLISAPAGFGKTTLVSEWAAGFGRLEPQVRAAWLSLDEGDNDPLRFLAYLIAALQTIAANVGAGALGALQMLPPPTESIMTTLLNEITALPDPFVLVLDDYDVIEAKPVDQALTFLLEHLPPQMHLVITTREDPQLPLARLRARGQLTELRAADLRFTAAEAAEFLNPMMGLNLAAADIAALEARTEGWIAGLQLAALSMQGQTDVTGFIQSFTGSHKFVLDYLVEEVLHQQSENVQTFLLRTSILDRLCGPLCEALLLDPSVSGQATLEYIERANLFIVPLDNERRWYRYHHLFADLLRQRLGQPLLQGAASAAGTVEAGRAVDALHQRASQWYEDHGLELEAFHHAAAAQDVERAARLVEGQGMPLYYRGAAAPVMHWLASLPTAALDARPALWVMYASTLLFSGQNTAVEQKLQAAEAALRAERAQRSAEPDEQNRDLVGRIAALRATLAVIQHDVATILAQSRRALEYLHPDNLTVRTATTWSLGYAYQLQGDRAAASQAYAEVISSGQSFGNSIYTLAATLSLGQVQETENQLHLAAESYQRSLQLAGDPPQGMACEAFLGLARICYEWNDLGAAEQHGQQSVQVAGQAIIDTIASYEVLVARLRLAQEDVTGAVAALAKAEAFARKHKFLFRMPDVAAAQVLTRLRQGRPEAVAAAAQLAETHALPLSQARVHLAQGHPAAALAALEPLRQQAVAKGRANDILKVRVLQALALQAQGENEQAVQVLGDALALAEPGGFVRTFVDEGAQMAQLLSEAAAHGIRPDYVGKLLAAFGKPKGIHPAPANTGRGPSPLTSSVQPLVEPLSDREQEVLRLLGTEMNGPAMARELGVSLNTLHTHTQNIYNKLGVNNRREAVRRAEELNLL
jgi:LuxR family transcriptional regulator, maltose regulon positive regulatory protein